MVKLKILTYEKHKFLVFNINIKGKNKINYSKTQVYYLK